MHLLKGLFRGLKTESRRHFIQPLAVALVFLLFALLFFGMAMMDLGRLENLLMDSLRKKATYVVDVTEKASLEKHTQLMRVGEQYRSMSGGTVLNHQGFSLQEALVRELIGVARQADREARSGGPVEEKLRELCESEYIREAGLFDDFASISAQSAPLPPEILTQIEAIIRGREEISINLFHALQAQEPGYIAIRRQDGKGAVVLVLDRQGLEHWGWRVAIQAAIDDLHWGTGIAYLSVADRNGRILAGYGNIPREKVEECLLMAGAAREAGAPEGQCVMVGDTKFLELSLPFQSGGKPLGTAFVGLETHETEQLLLENQKRIFLWTALMMLVGLFALGMLYRTQNRHISRIQDISERLHHAERLSSLGKLAAGVAHEIRNPLNAISMAAQRLQQEFVPGEDDRKEKFERISHIIRNEIRRLNKIVEDFLSLSRSDRMELREQSLTPLLDQILFLAREEGAPKGIRIEKGRSDPGIRVLMDAGKMEQALLNIIRNAMESISGEGCITVSCDIQGKYRACITISDTGSGIPAGEEKRIFDPFYTSKKNGIGLGLAISHEIVVAHGGEIRVESEAQKGTTFHVLLPRLP
ncbi:MAG: hypothetical protein LLG06_09955 [Desulfobacteraceae bacterium]|nr:hypothetical protein [Desulfobacteraceae bacterium]